MNDQKRRNGMENNKLDELKDQLGKLEGLKNLFGGNK